MDMVGSLGVFYSETSVSSSLNVLCEFERRKVIYPKILHGIMPDFIPGADTEYVDIKRLLPSQIYDYINNRLINRPILPDGVITTVTEQKRTELLVDYFMTSLKNMESHFKGKSIWLALTGGRDSRTTLAFLEKANIQYSVFTLEYDNISTGDIVISKKLASILEKNYIYVNRKTKKYSASRKKDYKKQTAGMAVDEDVLFYVYGQYQHLQTLGNNEIVILRSGIWECVIEYFQKYIKEDISIDNVTQLFRGIKYNKKYESSLRDWFNYIKNDKLNKEWNSINRIYIELRAGCWLSSIEQSFDMMDGIISVQPVNCRLFLSLLMGYNQDDRVEKVHQEKIINYICPDISEVPFGDSFLEDRIGKIHLKKIKSLIKKGCWCLANWGLNDTINYLRNK